MATPTKRSGHPLSATFVERVSKPGTYGDGRGGYGLYLRVHKRSNERTAKMWGQRVIKHGRPTSLGLGAYPLVTLAEARAKALQNRREIGLGREPLPTFGEAAELVIKLHAASWKHPERLARRWRQTFRDTAFPAFGSKPVDTVTSADVLGALAPIWTAKPAAARQALQRIAAVMKWSVAQGFRTDDPAAEATAALPRQNGKTEHHRALAHQEVGAAIRRVLAAKRRDPSARLAFQFCALTAARSAEVLGSRWCEIDLPARVWTVPPERMKAGRAHRVPLSGAAVAVLDEARKLHGARARAHIFCSRGTGGTITPQSLRGLAAELTDSTVHGLRSSFRNWAAENGVDRAVAEAALAHIVGGVEGAYNRTDLVDRRRAVMEAWAEYLGA